MFFRRTALAAGIVTLATAVLVTTAGAARGGSPSTPTNLRITATTETSVSLAWNASTGNNFWYCVQRNGSGCIRVDPPRTTMTWPQLAPGTTHTFSVYAIDSRGHRSGNSNSVTYTTPPDTTPPSPAPQLTVSAVRPIRFSVTWTPLGRQREPGLLHALHQRQPVLRQPDRSQRPRDLRPHAVDDVHGQGPGGRCGGQLRRERHGVGHDAAGHRFEPPTAPTNLTLSPESSPPEIWTDWTQSTDNVDPQSDILYDVYLDGIFEEHAALGYGSTITYCRDMGPTVVTMKAVDSSGNVSGPSNELLFDC